MQTAFNVGDTVAYWRGGWQFGVVEKRSQELAVDKDGHESTRLMIGLRDEDCDRLIWRDIRQCAAMIAGQHVQSMEAA